MNFVSEWSWWYFPLFAIISILISWYFVYHGEKSKYEQNWLRICLFILRSVSLFIVLILLMGIFFNHYTVKEEKPVIITLIDNSYSMLNDVDEKQLKNNVNNLITRIENSFPNLGKKFFTIGEKFRRQKNIHFNEQSTNLSEGFENIFQLYNKKNIGSIILISDGNYNIGLNPIYSTSKLPFVPIYTLGVGSEIEKKDQILKEVNHNDIAFYKNKFNVQINIESFLCNNKISKVKILKNGKTISEQKIKYSGNKSDFKQINFELEANNIGFQRYEAIVESLDDEYTLKNNSLSFYIEVLESRNKILLLSGAPHPDITALKNVFNENVNISSEFKLIDNWDRNLDKVDLIVWHEPGISFSEQICQKILTSKIPILYFIGTQTQQNIVNKLKIGLNQSSQNQSDEYQATFEKSFQLFDLNDKTIQVIEKYPPIIGKYGNINLNKQNTILFSQKVANISKNDPLCFIGENEFEKYCVFLGKGVWHWKMSEFASNKNSFAFSELFSSINQYLVRKSNSSQLRIKLPKRVLSSEKININAEFYNESLEKSTKVKIGYHLIDSKGKKAELEFGLQDEQYSLELSKLKPGIYSWKAFTEYNSKKFEKSGSFVVEDLLLEKRDNKANHKVLRDISEKSHAKFYLFNERDKLVKSLSERNDIKPILYKVSEIDLLLEFVWILIFIVLLLSIEWFLRRYFRS